MLRHILKRLTSEKLIEYLSQTYLIKRAAQMTVEAFYRFSGDNLNQNHRVRRILNLFKDNLKREIQDVQKKIKKN